MNKDRYIWEDVGDMVISSCITCKHKAKTRIVCNAYPQGIPEELLTGKVVHKTPYKGDHGIQYEPIKQ